MDSNFVEWMYLKQLVGNFEDLINYYFGAIYYYGPWFRQASVALLYSVGLALVAFNALKAPVDRLQAALGTLGMIALAGFLVSPTTNTKNLGSASGTELSVGAYYSYLLAGTISQSFTDVITASWKGSISDAAGIAGGPSKDALTLAFNDKADQFAEKFIKGEGKEAVKDYFKQCGSEALNSAKTPKEKAILRSVGIGSNTLGMDSKDATTLSQQYDRQKNNNLDWAFLLSAGSGSDQLGGMGMERAASAEQKMIDQNRTEAETFLKNLPSANSSIDGTKGYRIPTKEYYQEKLSNKDGTDTSTTDSFRKLSASGGNLAEMLPNGATTTTAGTEDDYVFYPKNCYDLYLVASETMNSLRNGAKDVKGYENLGLTQAYTAMTAANKVRRGLNDQINAELADLGIDEKVNESLVEAISDTAYGAMESLGNDFNKWMLEYKIPAMISGMALLVCLLLVTFPIFALISVVFGSKVLISYFKFMALPFIVVFTNNLLLSISANLIAFNKVTGVLAETFVPGGVDVPASISVMNTETIIYSVITFCEIAIAKFILWDDVRAATSFSMGRVGTDAASKGASLTGSMIALAAGVFGRGARLASAGKSAKATQALNQTISGISKQVTNIANGATRSQNRSTGLSGGGGSGGGGSGGGGGGTGGGAKANTTPQSSKTPGGGASLNPPPPTQSS